jgi:hypothetical protein
MANFNLVRNGWDLLRWVDHRIHLQPAVGEHVKNLGMIFGLSHVVETLSGPVGALAGAQIGLPDAVNWIILTAGGIISIPGLDPLCIILAAAYKGSRGFRDKSTKVRVTLVRTSKAVVQKLRLDSLAAKFGVWQDGGNRVSILLSNQPGITDMPTSGGALKFDSDSKKTWLSRVQIDDQERFSEFWQSLRSEVDANTWHAVKKLIELGPGDSVPFYVSTISDGNEYRLLPAAVQPWGRWRWCGDLLK